VISAYEKLITRGLFRPARPGSPAMTAGDGIVLVTGGRPAAFGAATASLLTEQAQRVVVVDIAPNPAGYKAALWPEAFDVASETAVVSGIAAHRAAHGPIGGLVNACGGSARMHAAESRAQDNWDREITLIASTFSGCSQCRRRMAGGGMAPS